MEFRGSGAHASGRGPGAQGVRSRLVRPLRQATGPHSRGRSLSTAARLTLELVGGVLVETSPQGPLHNTVIRRLTGVLVRALGEAYEVGVQVPLAVDDLSLSEPDFVVVPAGRFVAVHPDVAVLVVEVAFSSQRFDLGEKARRYAAAGFPELGHRSDPPRRPCAPGALAHRAGRPGQQPAA